MWPGTLWKPHVFPFISECAHGVTESVSKHFYGKCSGKNSGKKKEDYETFECEADENEKFQVKFVKRLISC